MQHRLKELLHYDPLSGIFTRKTAAGGFACGSECGTSTYQGYISIGIDEKQYLAHRLAFLYMTGHFPQEQIDHIDRCRDNNKWSNLRSISNAENQKNKGRQKNNSSGITGVTFTGKKWRAVINRDGKRINLGTFASKEEAAMAREQAERDLL